MIKSNVSEQDHAHTSEELEAGSVICHGLYTIDGFLNSGGWGKAYTAINSLNQRVVVKECFPSAFCRRDGMNVVATSPQNETVFRAAVKNFIFEAQSIADFDHPSIVRVHQVFEDCGTGYIAMEFVEGSELHGIVEGGFRFGPDVFSTVMTRLLDCVDYLHSHNTLHRDIASDNVIMRGPDDPVLIDFGAAKQIGGKQGSKMLVAKDGFSPIEFYDKAAEQTVRSDIYALGATLYFALTGTIPVSAKSRFDAVANGQPDPYVPLTGQFADIDDRTLSSIDRALALRAEDRFASIKDWQVAFTADSNVVQMPHQRAAQQPEPTPQVAVEAPQKKSKAGLMSAAAAIAIVAVGAGGYFAMNSGGSDAPAAELAAEKPAEAVAPVVVSAVPSQVVESNELAVAEPATSPALQTASVEADPAVASAIVTPVDEAAAQTASIKPNVPDLPQPTAMIETLDQPQEIAAVTRDHGVETSAVFDVARPSMSGFDAPSASASTEAPVIAMPTQLQPRQITEAEWTPNIPFRAEMARSSSGRTVVRVRDVNPVLGQQSVLRPGAVIVSVNGRQIRNTGDLSRVINEERQKGSTDHLYKLRVVSTDANGRGHESGEIVFADTGRIVLANGLEIEAMLINSIWQFRVTKAARGSDLREGDLISGANGSLIEDYSDLAMNLNSAVSEDRVDVAMLVQRGGLTIPANLTLALR